MTTSRSALLELFAATAGEVTERDLGAVQESAQISALGLDSLALLEVVGAMERRLGVQLPDDELVALATVSDLIDLVERRQRARAARAGVPGRV